MSAGAVLWRRTAGQADGTDVLLVHRPKYDDWSLPKGKQEPGEHVLLTAVREVLEETSVRPVLGPRLPTTEYLVRGRPKHVDYWSATAPGADAAPSHEIDAVAWLTLPHAAAARLSYARDAEVITRLKPRATVPLILARHVSAGAKGAWPDAGPATAAGRRGHRGRAAPGRPAGLLRPSRPGDQLTRRAVRRQYAPVRRSLRRVGRG